MHLQGWGTHSSEQFQGPPPFIQPHTTFPSLPSHQLSSPWSRSTPASPAATAPVHPLWTRCSGWGSQQQSRGGWPLCAPLPAPDAAWGLQALSTHCSHIRFPCSSTVTPSWLHMGPSAGSMQDPQWAPRCSPCRMPSRHHPGPPRAPCVPQQVPCDPTGPHVGPPAGSMQDPQWEPCGLRGVPQQAPC